MLHDQGISDRSASTPRSCHDTMKALLASTQIAWGRLHGIIQRLRLVEACCSACSYVNAAAVAFKMSEEVDTLVFIACTKGTYQSLPCLGLMEKHQKTTWSIASKYQGFHPILGFQLFSLSALSLHKAKGRVGDNWVVHWYILQHLHHLLPLYPRSLYSSNLKTRGMIDVWDCVAVHYPCAFHLLHGSTSTSPFL